MFDHRSAMRLPLLWLMILMLASPAQARIHDNVSSAWTLEYLPGHNGYSHAFGLAGFITERNNLGFYGQGLINAERSGARVSSSQASSDHPVTGSATSVGMINLGATYRLYRAPTHQGIGTGIDGFFGVGYVDISHYVRREDPDGALGSEGEYYVRDSSRTTRQGNLHAGILAHAGRFHASLSFHTFNRGVSVGLGFKL